MARKTLLNEAEIRRFMKLANMGTVGDAKIQEYGSPMPGARDDEMGEPAMDEPAMDEPAMDEPAEAPVDDLGDDMDMEPEPEMGDDAGGMMISIDDFMNALDAALEEVTGETVEHDVDLGAEDAEDQEGGDVALDGPEAEPEELDVGAEEEEAVDMDMPMQEQLVDMVAARVAKRLVAESRKAQMTDELTERIFKRLTESSK